MDTLIIIPAYNVERQLGAVLELLPTKDLVIINDGSTDSTDAVIRQYDVKCINLAQNAGVGNALKLGISYGLKNGYSHAITIDADGQHDPLLLESFKSTLHYADFVIGNRFHDISNIPDQKLSSNFFASILVHAIFNVKLHDVSCGYRAFKLNSLNIVDGLSDSYGFLYDLLFQNIYSIDTISIPCIYDYSEFLTTRISELLGFLEGIQKYATQCHHKHLIEKLINDVNHNNDIHFSLMDFNISAFSIPEFESYVFQTDKEKIRWYYET